MINSRDIKDLHPKLQELCHLFIAECEKAGIKVVITSTYRDFAAQTALYAQGRTMPGKIVTKAKAGESVHNYRLAFDFAPLIEGKIAWNNTQLFTTCGKIAEKCGLEWGGSWKSFKDLPHCQYTEGLSIADLKSGKMIADKEIRSPK